MCASVITGVYAPPILEIFKHVLDFMAVPIEAKVIWNLDFSVGFRGNTGLNSTVSEGGAEPICVISQYCHLMSGNSFASDGQEPLPGLCAHRS